jgi:hypothetical protein
VSSRPAASATCATGAGEDVGAERAGGLGIAGQRGVVLHRQRRQREPGRSAGQDDPGALDAQVDRLRRQRADDVREQASGTSTRPGSAAIASRRTRELTS